MLQDRHQIFQNGWRNGWEKLTWSWQPPCENGQKFTALDLFHLRERLPTSSSCFLGIYSLILKGLVPILQHISWIFGNTPTFSFLMNFRGVMAMSTRITLFLVHPVCICVSTSRAALSAESAAVWSVVTGDTDTEPLHSDLMVQFIPNCSTNCVGYFIMETCKF